MITNYTQLKNEVADWSHRDNLTSKMDVFCQFAEQIINYGYEWQGRTVPGLRSKEMEKRESQSFDATFFSLPADYIEMIALEIEYSGRRNPLRQVSPQILDTTYSLSNGANPRAYTIQNGQIEFRPGIDAASPYIGELTYYAEVPSLTSNSTNDVLDELPMVYLSTMMLALNLYTQDDEQINQWITFSSSAIKGANNNKGKYVLPQVRIC